MPAIRHDDLLLRLLKDINDVKAALRRTVANLPLYDIANENTPAQITADQDDYPPGNYDNLRLSTTKTITITGFRAGVKGRSLKLFNVGNFGIILAHQDTGSLAANRMKFNSGARAYIAPGSNLVLYYDATISRWIASYEIPAPHPRWTRVVAPSGTWNDVIFVESLGYYVAVGSSACATSTDGKTWTPRSVPAVTWNALAYSPELGLLVAIGNNAVITSTDGITWTSRTPASSNNWYGITWAPELGLFVAVSITGTGDRVMTSPNGVTWTPQVSAADQTWRDVAWSPELGLLAAISDQVANSIMTSPDGVAWTVRADPSGGEAIEWNSEKMVFVTPARYSTDGITWTASTNAPTTFPDIFFNQGTARFVAPGNTASYTTEDGRVWTTEEGTGINLLCGCYSVTLNQMVVLGASTLAVSP